MKRIVLAALAVFMMTGILTGVASASPGVALDKRVSLDLRGATAEEAFRSLARVAGVPISVEGVSGEVTLELENVRVRTILAAICDSIGCRWELHPDGKVRITPLSEAERPKPRVKPSAAALDAPIDLKVTDASVRDILDSVAEIMSAKAFVDSAVGGKVSLEMDNRPLREALDAVCNAAKCTWSFDAHRGVLSVKPKA